MRKRYTRGVGANADVSNNNGPEKVEAFSAHFPCEKELAARVAGPPDLCAGGRDRQRENHSGSSGKNYDMRHPLMLVT